MKDSSLGNQHKNKDGKLMTILSIWYYKRNILPDVRLMKHKARMFSYGGMQQWGVNYWETFVPVIYLISVGHY